MKTQKEIVFQRIFQDYIKLKTTKTCNILLDLFSPLFFLSFICLHIPSRYPTSVGARAHRNWKMTQLSQCICLPWTELKHMLDSKSVVYNSSSDIQLTPYRFTWAWRWLKVDIWVWNWTSPTHVTNPNLVLNLYPSLKFLSPFVQLLLILPLHSFWACFHWQQFLKLKLPYCCLRKERQQLSEQRNL